MKLTIALVPALMSLTTAAWAADCADNADCDEGYECQKAQWVDGCAPDSMECDTTVHEAETGSCVKLPVECQHDADCGEYLICAAVPTPGTCAMSPDGSTTCDAPTAEPKSYCAMGSKGCEVDSDCPREFECVQFNLGCAVPDDCVDAKCACETTTAKECQPKRIECETDAACPTDWRCINNVTSTCSGGGGTSMGAGGATSAGEGEPSSDPGMPAPPEEAAPPSGPTPADGMQSGAPDERKNPEPPMDVPTTDPNCTTAPAVGNCVPAEWADSMHAVEDGGLGIPANDPGETPGDTSGPKGGDDGLVDAPSGEPPRAEGPADESADQGSLAKGGCVAAPGAPTRAAWSLLGLLFLAPLMRRRASDRAMSDA